MKRHKFRFDFFRKDPIGRWYTLARKHAAIMYRRTLENPRCRRCFYLGVRLRYDVNKVPWCGCDGCAEAENFFIEAKNFFSDLLRGEGQDGH